MIVFAVETSCDETSICILNDRKQKVIVNGINSEPVNVKSGVPQGSCRRQNEPQETRAMEISPIHAQLPRHSEGRGRERRPHAEVSR